MTTTPEQRAAWLERHKPSGRFPYTERVDICEMCLADWPCDASALLAEVEALQVLVEAAAAYVKADDEDSALMVSVEGT